MNYKQLGNSGIPVSAITFGAWAIGNDVLGGTNRKNAIDALRKAWEMGCTSIDTAPIYRCGFSEEVVAEAIEPLPRHQIQLFTKCGHIWEEEKGRFSHEVNFNGVKRRIYKYAGKESVIRECENSLRRLKTDYIDLYSLHWPPSIIPGEGTMEAFIRLREQGKIRAGGVCNHSAEEMQLADNVFDLSANKVTYSMLDRRIEQDLVPYCKKNNKSIMVYRVLQRGLLEGLVNTDFLGTMGEPYRERAFFLPENVQRIHNFLEKLKPVAKDHGATIPQLCIRWALDQPGISVVLLGALTAEQVVHDARALDISLSEDEKNTINGYLAGLESELELEEPRIDGNAVIQTTL